MCEYVYCTAIKDVFIYGGSPSRFCIKSRGASEATISNAVSTNESDIWRCLCERRVFEFDKAKCRPTFLYNT